MSNPQMEIKDFQDTPYGKTFRVMVFHPIQNGYSSPCMFVAKKGGGPDWAIYYFPIDELNRRTNGFYNEMEDYVRIHGDKVRIESVIRTVVPCSDEVLKRYRY